MCDEKCVVPALVCLMPAVRFHHISVMVCCLQLDSSIPHVLICRLLYGSSKVFKVSLSHLK